MPGVTMEVSMPMTCLGKNPTTLLAALDGEVHTQPTWNPTSALVSLEQSMRAAGHGNPPPTAQSEMGSTVPRHTPRPMCHAPRNRTSHLVSIQRAPHTMPQLVTNYRPRTTGHTYLYIWVVPPVAAEGWVEAASASP